MDCRIGCGACCIAPSISSPIPGMPSGKPAGVRCVQLSEKGECRIWGTSEYPEVCRGFRAMPDVCGQTRDEALALLAAMEKETKP
jgi:Fe-S-cluster containining protein